MGSEHGDDCLLLEVAHLGIGPGEEGAVGDVDQAHGAARVAFAGCADGHGTSVGEGQFLAVAGGAGGLAVDGEAGVVEEIAAEFDLGGGHGVVGRDARFGKALGEVPGVVAGGGAEGGGGEQDARKGSEV